ncbi:MAG: type II secretion system major pseudopilin GspG [Chthoniobacteraceae bacterium]
MNKPIQSPKNGAFTLVEMLLVLVILATLAAIVYPKLAGRTQQAQLTAAKSQIASISLALNAYEVDNGYYPKSLDALINQPGDANNWHGPYLEKAVPLDPWNNSYLYEYPGKHTQNGFDLMSAGPDGRTGTDDDINNWDANKR